MRSQNKRGTDYHPKSCLSRLVNEGTEKRGENNREERNHREHPCRSFQLHPEKRDQNRGPEFLETDDAAVEEDAEQGYHQESRIAQHFPYIRKPELVLLRGFSPVSQAPCLVKACIHSHEYSPEYASDSQKCQSEHCRTVGVRKHIHLTFRLLRDNHRGKNQGGCGTKAGN